MGIYELRIGKQDYMVRIATDGYRELAIPQKLFSTDFGNYPLLPTFPPAMLHRSLEDGPFAPPQSVEPEDGKQER